MKTSKDGLYNFGTMALSMLEELETMSDAIKAATPKDSQGHKLSLITYFLIQNYTTMLNDLRVDLGIDKP